MQLFARVCAELDELSIHVLFLEQFWLLETKHHILENHSLARRQHLAGFCKLIETKIQQIVEVYLCRLSGITGN